jgi:integrase
MTGLHVVKKKIKGGLRWHVYAYRGGPNILTVDGARPAITPALLEKAFEMKRQGAPAGTVSWLAAEYRADGDFTGLALETQRDYRKSLDRIEDEFGAYSLEIFEDRRMRGDIIQWRDKWRPQPRTADKLTVMLGTLLGWALVRGYVAINVAAGIPQIHSADRSDLIWEECHWSAIRALDDDGEPICPPQLMDALTVASLTGLRLGDLVSLDWSHVGENAIVLVTKKRKGRAVIPILPELRAWLNARPKKEGSVLVNSRGKAWSTSGLGSVFQKAKPEGFDRTIHDLRGTFVTFLAVKGLTDEEIARIVGWTAKRVAEVRARYVDEARVVVELTKRLSA